MASNAFTRSDKQKTICLSIIQIFLIGIFLIGSYPTYAQSKGSSTSNKAVPHLWEIGAFAGGGTIFGDLTAENSDAIKALKPAFGLSLNRNINSFLSIRGGLLFSRLSDEKERLLANNEIGKVHNQTQLSEFSLALYYEPFGARRMHGNGHFKKICSPYVFAGIALAHGQSKINHINIEPTPQVIYDQEHLSNNRGALLLGVGAKYDLSRKIYIGIEAGIRPTDDDFLDGISQSGNPLKNDWYGFGGITVHYRIGKIDTDGDGIVDAADKCPNAPGDTKFKGCPDSDNDGIPNWKDDCPEIAGLSILKGCPDRDKDGVADHIDKCPNEKGMMRLLGCPDKDWDNVIDSEDECPDIAGEIELKGCPEPIITDLEIKQNEKAAEEFVAANDDENAEIEALLNNNSDTTNPSVLQENLDLDNLPEKNISEIFEIPEVVSVDFKENSNDFNTETYRVLKEIASILPGYPDRVLHISSYAELGDNGVVNQGIAGKRVFSCYKYLLQAGVDRSQMIYYNYKKLPPKKEDAGKVFFSLKK